MDVGLVVGVLVAVDVLVSVAVAVFVKVGGRVEVGVHKVAVAVSPSLSTAVNSARTVA